MERWDVIKLHIEQYQLVQQPVSFSEGFFYPGYIPWFYSWVLFPEVCDTRVFLVTNFKILTDNEQSPISTHTTYTPHINK